MCMSSLFHFAMHPLICFNRVIWSTQRRRIYSSWMVGKIVSGFLTQLLSESNTLVMWKWYLDLEIDKCIPPFTKLLWSSSYPSTAFEENHKWTLVVDHQGQELTLRRLALVLSTLETKETTQGRLLFRVCLKRVSAYLLHLTFLPSTLRLFVLHRVLGNRIILRFLWVRMMLESIPIYVPRFDQLGCHR